VHRLLCWRARNAGRAEEAEAERKRALADRKRQLELVPEADKELRAEVTSEIAALEALREAR
jgi:hypothetical protein